MIFKNSTLKNCRFICVVAFLALALSACGLTASWKSPPAEDPDNDLQEEVASEPAGEGATAKADAASQQIEGDTAEPAVETQESVTEEVKAGKSKEELEAQREKAPLAAGRTSVELLWQVPSGPVDKYHLAYGSEPTALDSKVEIPIRELEKIDDPSHGPLFRYIVEGVTTKGKLYFTIQAENQYGKSSVSPVQEVEIR